MKKVGRNAVVPGGVEFRPSQNAREVPSTQVGAQRTDANLGHRAVTKPTHRKVRDVWGTRIVSGTRPDAEIKESPTKEKRRCKSLRLPTRPRYAVP
jgi:hypothetical protein